MLPVVTEVGQVKIHLQRYLGESVRVSKTAVWMKRDLSTTEWQVALVQVLERIGSFGKEGE